MRKDKRFLGVKILLQKKLLHSFDEIFDHLPITVLCRKLAMSKYQIRQMRLHPEKMQLEVVFKLANLIGVESFLIYELITKNWADDYEPNE